MGTPPTSVNGGRTEVGGQQGTTTSKKLMASIRGLLIGLKKTPGNIYRVFFHPREEFRSRQDPALTVDSEADLTFPHNEVTRLRFKEGKLSDSRWWYPFRLNRKQKYAEIQKIIGDGKLRPPQHLEDEAGDEDTEIACSKPTHFPEVL